jgi:prophage regulatory protein
MPKSFEGIPWEDLELMDEKEVLRVVDVSKSTWYRGIRDGKFPKPVQLGVRRNKWRPREIHALIEKGRPAPRLKKGASPLG